MHRDDFTNDASGRLVPLHDGANAFLPDPLPPNLRPTWELSQAESETRAAISELMGQARLIRNLDLVTRPLARREVVLSSRMEGTQTEIRELLLSEAEAQQPQEDSDIFEVLNYLATIELAQDSFNDGRSLNLPLVNELHARLIRGVRGQAKRPGALRLKDVYIGNRAEGIQKARYVPPPAEQVPALMEDLFAFMSASSVYTPLIDAAVVHYQFEAIHPYEDGNGRLGRLLIPLQLIQAGVVDRPLLYMGPTLFERDEEYRDRLLAVSTSGDWAGWVTFLLDTMRAAAVDALTRVRRVVDLHEHYRQLVTRTTNSRATLPALDVVMEKAFVSVRDITGQVGTTHPTARAAIESLVELGILVEHARLHGRQVWRAEELLRQVYD